MDGPPAAPFWPDGYPALPGPGLTLTPLLGCPAPPPATAGKCVRLTLDQLLLKTRST